MAQLNITQAAVAVNISKRTMQRKIKAGEVSYRTNANGHKLIDTSELMRVFGELSPPLSQELSPLVTPLSSPNEKAQLDDLADKLAEAIKKIDALTNEVVELKSTILRLEHKEVSTSEYQSENTNQTLDDVVIVADKNKKTPERQSSFDMSLDDIPSFLDM